MGLVRVGVSVMVGIVRHCSNAFVHYSEARSGLCRTRAKQGFYRRGASKSRRNHRYSAGAAPPYRLTLDAASRSIPQ